MFRSCIWLTILIALAGCEPTAEQKAHFAERRRLECLQQYCPGDVLPTYNTMTHEAIKLNGQWFIGPKEYFSSGTNGGAFYWPSKTPVSPKVQDFPEKAAATSGHANDVTIEIFLRSHNGFVRSPSFYKALQIAETHGQVITKTVLRPGLVLWRVKEDDGYVATWFTADELRDSNGEPPILFCRREDEPKSGVCTTGFIWVPGIAADLRFRAKHAQDWPEVYQEVIRVLNLLKKA